MRIMSSAILACIIAFTPLIHAITNTVFGKSLPVACVYILALIIIEKIYKGALTVQGLIGDVEYNVNKVRKNNNSNMLKEL